MNISELDKLYRDAEACDDQLFSEMRSNILLVSGDHYNNKRTSKYWDRIQNSKGLKNSTKLRLTKNHTATICARKVGKILSHAPNTMITPNNMDEMQDQKTAELNESVWKYVKKKHNIRAKIRRWGEDFVHLGECWAKIYWDETKGALKGYEQATDEEGQPLFEETTEEVVDQMGQKYSQVSHKPLQDEEAPVMEGDFVFDRIFGFNVLRCSDSQSLEESPYIIIRKMIDKREVKEKVSEKVFADMSENEETYLVFDSDTASYGSEKNKVMLREHYYRPCMRYPQGYFFITVRGNIIEEGELPYGVFPIRYAGHSEIPTSCRFRSPIKQMRSYQIEINRAASKIAETQITLGDDKLILNNNAKMSSGGTLAGIRGVKVNGATEDIKILAGRSGEQYLPYMQSQIQEMYMIMDEGESNESGQFDPFAMLYFSNRNKQRYRKHAEEFEEFLVGITEIFLELAKHYYDEDMIIPMIGKTEMVNIKEFKNTEKNSFRIKVENVADDNDTMMGRQLSINHVLQYVGKDLGKDAIGKMVKNMPYMNDEEMFGDLTMDYDMAKNDMLAMERGEQPMVTDYDDHKFLIKTITNRMKKADFRFLDPQIQQMYQQYIQQHGQIEAKIADQLQRAQAGFIPTTGVMSKADLYITNDMTGKIERAKFPAASLEWLRDQLKSQGEVLSDAEDMNPAAVAQIAGMQEGQQGPQQGPPQQNGPMGPPQQM